MPVRSVPGCCSDTARSGGPGQTSCTRHRGGTHSAHRGLGAEAHHVAAEVVRIGAPPVQYITAREERAPPLVVQELALEVVAQRVAAHGGDSGRESVEAVSALVAAQCRELCERLALAESRAVPAVIACRASMKAHRVANAMTMLCGWAWAAEPAATVQANEDWPGSWCRMCARSAERMRGVRLHSKTSVELRSIVCFAKVRRAYRAASVSVALCMVEPCSVALMDTKL